MTKSDLASPPDRVLTIGPRQLDVLRLLWEHGPATVRQLHTWLVADPPIAYTTVQTICQDLTTKGLLERRPASETAAPNLKGNPYIYEPTIATAAFRHVMVGRTRRMIAPYPADPFADAPPHTEAGGATQDAALRERLAAAERTATHWESVAHRAERRIEALERRAQAAERRAEKAERRLKILQEQLSRPPRPRPTPRPPREIIVEHRDEAGICRVCAAPAPPAYKSRKDGLRVCGAERCRAEAQRRDNLAKQHRYVARRSASGKSV